MHDMHKLAMGVTFTHMSDKKGIKKHGERELADIYKEYLKLEYMKLMEVLDPDSLIISQKKVALRAINPIKEKQSRKLKGRTCAYGRPQIYFIAKEYASSPTISLKALFTSLIIYAHEGRYVSIFDVPWA